MKKWRRTTITWPMWNSHVSGDPLPEDGKLTTIPFYDGYGEEKGLCACTSITAESRHPAGARFDIKLVGARTKQISSSPGWYAARERLRPVLETISGAHVNSTNPLSLHIVLPMQLGERFTDNVIRFVGEIFRVFGIEDPKNNIRGNFEITQTTFVWQLGGWVPQEDWLRIRHNLSKPHIFCWTN